MTVTNNLLIVILICFTFHFLMIQWYLYDIQKAIEQNTNVQYKNQWCKKCLKGRKVQP